MKQTSKSQDATKPRCHWAVRTNYLMRASFFALWFVALGTHMVVRDYGAISWGLLFLQFLVYPHLLYWRALRAREPLQVERINLLLDCLLSGIWAAALGFPTVIAFALFVGTSLNNAVYRGWSGALRAFIAFSCGALAWVIVAGFSISPGTDLPVTVLCLAGLSAYVIHVGNLVFTQNNKLRDTREKLRKSEEHYRLITENAGDLIALIDAERRWVYASPSYRSLLSDAALAVGESALALVHPEDRHRVRVPLEKAIETGELKEFHYRLIAADGTEHEFEATANSFTHADGPRTVLVSIDITELRRSEKILDIYSHAFENMAEGMMLTLVDGTILSINKAFTTITGYRKEDVLGKSETEFHTALQPPKFYVDMQEELTHTGYWVGTAWSRRKDNSLYRERRSVSAIQDEAGRTTHYIAFVSVAGDTMN